MTGQQEFTHFVYWSGKVWGFWEDLDNTYLTELNTLNLPVKLVFPKDYDETVTAFKGFTFISQQVVKELIQKDIEEHLKK